MGILARGFIIRIKMITKYNKDNFNDIGLTIISKKKFKIDKKAIINFCNRNDVVVISSWGSLIVGTIIGVIIF